MATTFPIRALPFDEGIQHLQGRPDGPRSLIMINKQSVDAQVDPSQGRVDSAVATDPSAHSKSHRRLLNVVFALVFQFIMFIDLNNLFV